MPKNSVFMKKEMARLKDSEPGLAHKERLVFAVFFSLAHALDSGIPLIRIIGLNPPSIPEADAVFRTFPDSSVLHKRGTILPKIQRTSK